MSAALLPLGLMGLGAWLVWMGIRGQGFERPYRGTYRVTRGFGLLMHPIEKRLKPHTGIDIALPTGTELYPVAPGIVDHVLPDSPHHGAGNTVYVNHEGGWQSVYMHLSKIAVNKGDAVRRSGDDPDRWTLLGRSGNTGKSTGPHLHFELRRRLPDGSLVPVDPKLLIPWV